MIVTITPNPALDVTTRTTSVRPGVKLRCRDVRYDPGGGGVNVARVAHELGAQVLATLPVGGLTGQRITDLLAAAGVPFRAVPISEVTRESFTIDETASGQQFRFVLPGPTLTAVEQSALLEVFSDAVRSCAFVVASGSLPPEVAADFYDEAARIAHQHGARLVLDSSGVALAGLRMPVFLLKPSIGELSELVGRDLRTREEQVDAARGLIEDGRAEVVVVSLAAQGALVASAGGYSWLPAVPVPPGSGVGAGDALVAGIVVALERGWPLADAIDFGMAAGAAMLLSPGTQVCRRVDVERLFAFHRSNVGRRADQAGVLGDLDVEDPVAARDPGEGQGQHPPREGG